MTKSVVVILCAACVLAGCGKKQGPSAQPVPKKSPAKTARTMPSPMAQEMKEKVEKIIAAGGDVNQLERDISILGWCVAHHAADAVRLLLENGADPKLKLHARGYDSPLFEAISSNLADTDSKLDVADQQHSAEIVKLLLKHGADPNEANGPVKETPLHKAAGRGRADIATALIEAGARIDAQDVLGNTPLHQAAKYGCFELVQLLKARGAKDSVNKLQMTALALAKERCDEDLYQQLAGINKKMIRGHDYDKTIALLAQ